MRLMHERGLIHYEHNDRVVVDYIRGHEPVSIYEAIDILGVDAIESVIRLVQYGAVDHANGVLRMRMEARDPRMRDKMEDRMIENHEASHEARAPAPTDARADMSADIEDENAVHVLNPSVSERVYMYMQERSHVRIDDVASSLAMADADLDDHQVKEALRRLEEGNLAVRYRDGRGRVWCALRDGMVSFAEAVRRSA